TGFLQVATQNTTDLLLGKTFLFLPDHRAAPYSTTASRNKLDTTQMATTSHTFVVVADAAAKAPPSAGRSPAPGEPELAAASAASVPSTSDTLSVAVAERAGSPWSRTTMTRRCRGPSASSSARAVLTSPLDPTAEASLCLSLQCENQIY
uniref:Uncharacterized protein n=1 Tax=Melopsittacus undulatus TaxID=13146 RepID=A0A8C6JI87_MELUD